MQNLKVDIIYHQSPSDFEMEFNLRANCPMRLLTDKTGDKKAFIKALARDVARSRVIICCGSLFGTEGLIHTVSKAIGFGTSACDSKTYGISGDETIHIISGSTPLVTPDGYFGGCIIESGPQTIILLTENKTFRKAIMKNLIHPYLIEISYIAPSSLQQSTSANENNPTAVSTNENYITKTDDSDTDDEEESKLPTAQSDDENNMDFVMDGEEDEEEHPQDDDTTVNNAYNDMYINVEPEEQESTQDQQPYTTAEGDKHFFFEQKDEKQKKDERKKNNLRNMDITIVILVLVLVLGVLALLYLVVLRPVSMGVAPGTYIKEIFGIVSENTLV